MLQLVHTLIMTGTVDLSVPTTCLLFTLKLGSKSPDVSGSYSLVTRGTKSTFMLATSLRTTGRVKKYVEHVQLLICIWRSIQQTIMEFV